MKIQVQSIHFNADQKLLDFIEEKVSKLDNYFDGIISSDVTLKLEKASNDENKVADIKLIIPGNDLFAKRKCKSFEEAVDACVEALRTQVKRHKEKLKSF